MSLCCHLYSTVDQRICLKHTHFKFMVEACMSVASLSMLFKPCCVMGCYYCYLCLLPVLWAVTNAMSMFTPCVMGCYQCYVYVYSLYYGLLPMLCLCLLPVLWAVTSAMSMFTPYLSGSFKCSVCQQTSEFMWVIRRHIRSLHPGNPDAKILDVSKKGGRN